MSLKFNNVNIIINTNNILCESLVLNQESPQKAAFVLNSSKPLDYISQSLKSSLNISYYIEPGNDPNYNTITGWKNNTTGNLRTVFNIGNIELVGYLSNYSFNVVPNSPIVAQANYQIFEPLTGNFIAANSGNADSYNTSNSLGIAHHWSANFTSGGNAITNNNVLQCDYSFNSDIIPSYKLGYPYPSQISCLGANEEINVVNEIQNNLSYTGGSYGNILGGIDTLTLKNISSNWGNSLGQINFPISGHVIQSNKMDLKVDDIVIYSHNMSRSY